MLDAVMTFLPSPVDMESNIEGVNPKTEEEETRKPNEIRAIFGFGI